MNLYLPSHIVAVDDDDVDGDGPKPMENSCECVLTVQKRS